MDAISRSGDYPVFLCLSTVTICGHNLIAIANYGPGVGLLNQVFVFFSVLLFSCVSIHWIHIKCHVHIWLMSPQLNCCDTHQIPINCKNIIFDFVISEISLTEQLMNGASMISTPDAKYIFHRTTAGVDRDCWQSNNTISYAACVIWNSKLKMSIFVYLVRHLLDNHDVKL